MNLQLRGSVLKGGTGATLFSFVAGFVLQGSYFVILARTLGPSEYGRFAGSLAIATVLATLSGAGSGNVLVMMTSRNVWAYRGQFGTALIYILTTFIPLFGVGLLVAYVSHAGLIFVVWPLLVSEILFGRVVDLSMQIFQAHDKLWGTAIINISAAAARLCMVLPFAGRVEGSAREWALIYALATITVASGACYACVVTFGGPRADSESLKTTWRVGIFYALGMSSRIAYTDTDKTILAASGLSEAAGHFAAGLRIINMAFTPLQALVYSSNTRLFRLGADGYGALWDGFVRRLLLIVCGYSVVAYVGLQVAGRYLPLVLGSDYSEVRTVLLIVGPLLLLQGIHYTLGDALMAAGRQALRSIAQMVLAAGSIVANLILVPIYGWVAAAVVALVVAAALAVSLAVVFAHGVRMERRESAREEWVHNARQEAI